MARTARRHPRRPAGRILAVAGAAAALAGAGTAAAASASAATLPAPGLPAALGTAQHATPLTGAPAPSPLTPAPAPAARHAAPARHTAAAVTTTAARHATTGTRHAARHAAKAPAAPAINHTPARPYQMYDSVTPSAIPGGHAVATYADGPYAATPSAVTGRPSVTWIDTNGSDPAGATALDVEPGDATPALAATWTAQRLNTHPHATAVIYTMRSEWPATQASIAGLPHWMQHHVRWWIADPTGTPHLVPGSNATQWYWGTNYDISTVTPNF